MDEWFLGVVVNQGRCKENCCKFFRVIIKKKDRNLFRMNSWASIRTNTGTNILAVLGGRPGTSAHEIEFSNTLV